MARFAVLVSLFASIVAKRSVTVLLCLFLLVPRAQLSAQTSSLDAPAAVSKDPQAIATIQNALSTLSSVATLVYQDSVATGTLAANIAGKPSSMPVVIKTRGTRMIRAELQKPKGTTIRIVNNGAGVIVQPDGSVQKLLTNNTIVERISHIPAFSILADFQDPSVSIESVGLDSIGGKSVNVVAVRPLPVKNISKSAWDRSTTKIFFWIDPANGTVAKIAYTNFAENDPNSGVKVEVLLSNYKSFQGVMVPLQQVAYSDGLIESVLTLDNITFNVGLLDSEFALPQ